MARRRAECGTDELERYPNRDGWGVVRSEGRVVETDGDEDGGVPIGAVVWVACGIRMRDNGDRTSGGWRKPRAAYIMTTDAVGGEEQRTHRL